MNAICRDLLPKAKKLGTRVACLNLFLVCGAAWAGFGDTVTVAADANASIPAGWVIVSKGYTGPQSYISTHKTRCFHTIQDLNGASYGSSLWVLGESPIPENWIITHRDVGDITSYNIKYHIKYVGGAPYKDTEKILHNSPIPNGWAIMQQHMIRPLQHPEYTIQNLNSQPSGSSVAAFSSLSSSSR